MEQIKILQIIDKWNYLNIKQISLLLNKNEATIRSQLKALKYKKLILVNKITTKNIYYLSALGRRYFGKKSQSIKINFAESKLQNLLISWLTSQKEIIEYKTQLELKHDSPREKVFPNLLIWYKDNSIEWVELDITEKIGILALSTLVIGALDKVLWNLVSHKTQKIKTKAKNSIFWLLRKLPFCRSISKTKEELEIKKNVEKTIENLTSDKLETKLKTQYDILKQELDNRKDKNHKELISNKTINYNSNSILENSSVEQLNPNNFDSSIRNTINQSNEASTSSNHNWNKVKCLLTT